MFKFLFVSLLIGCSSLRAEPLAKICDNPQSVAIGHLCPAAEVRDHPDFIPTAGQTLTKDQYPRLFEFFKHYQYGYCDLDLTSCKNADFRDPVPNFNPLNPQYQGEPFWYIKAK